MRRNTLIALAAVTVPVFLAALFLPAGGGATATVDSAGKVFPKLDTWISSATRLTVTGESGAVVIERKDPKGPISEGWGLPDKSGYPVKPGMMADLFGGLIALQGVEPKTDRPKLYARLDLDAPGKGSKSHELDLAKADGADILKLIVGKRRYDPLGQGQDGSYIRKPDDPRVWLAHPVIPVPSDELGWVDHTILDVDPATLREIDFTPAGGKKLVISREQKDATLTVQGLPKDAKLKAEDPTEGIAGAFRYLDLDDVKPAGDITGPATATAHFETFDGLSADVALTVKDGAWITVTAKGTGDAAAKTAAEITKRTAGWAYKIEDARAGTLKTTLADLLQPPPAKPEPGKGKTAQPQQ